MASQLTFEVLRFVAEPVSSEVALLELEGRFRAETRRRLGRPRLVVEDADSTREVGPVAAAGAIAAPDGSLWRASYAVALDELGGSVFSLGVGRELLLGLPAPDPAAGTGDREVRLAREANALRRTADEARAAAAAALESVSGERRAREAVEAELAEVRLARDDLTRRVAGLDEELAQARREHAEELVRRDAERETALAGRDEEAARAADDRVADLEAEVAEARRSLRAARAEAEGLRRDLERERDRADAAETAVRRGRVTEIAGEPVDGAEDRTTALGNGADDRTPLGNGTEDDRTAALENGTEDARTAQLGAPVNDRTVPLGDEDDDRTAPLGNRTDRTAPLGDERDDRTAPLPNGADEDRTAPLANGTDDDRTAQVGAANRRTSRFRRREEASPLAGDPADIATLDRPEPVEGDPGETVRVLGGRRPRRSGEGKPADPAPGTAAIGARHIEPGQTARRRALAAWLTRAVAFLALTAVVVAVLMVLKPF